MDTVIGEYTGEIVLFESNFITYYKRYPYKQKNESYIIDASKYGNILKFVNDEGNYNIEAIATPINNKWRIIYRAIKNIR